MADISSELYFYTSSSSAMSERIPFSLIPILLITRLKVDQIPRQLHPSLPPTPQRLKPRARQHVRWRQDSLRSAPASISKRSQNKIEDCAGHKEHRSGVISSHYDLTGPTCCRGTTSVIPSDVPFYAPSICFYGSRIVSPPRTSPTPPWWPVCEKAVFNVTS